MTWYNPTEGTWVVSGEFATSSILAGSGVWIEDAKGSGNLLITYTASGAKVFSSGVLQFSTLMAPAGVVTLADKGTLGSVKYHPRAFTDAEAIALATGDITVSFTLRNVFNNSPQGVWYDPSDTTTLFQDSAGTTPVTASGQPVGLMLDKSGRGNHATQPTAGSRPIYRRGDSRGVVNQLTWSEGFSNAGWTKANATVNGPEVTTTATGHALYRLVPVTPGASYVMSFIAKRGSMSDVKYSVYDLTSARDIVPSTSYYSRIDASGYTRVSVPFTAPAGCLTIRCYPVRDSLVTGTTFVTDVQLNLGPTALPYQRNDSHLGGVATGASTDLHWLETDGVDDGMATGNINFTGTDKVSVFAGVRKLSDAARAMLLELSAAGSAGSFAINAPVSTGSGFSFVSTGSAPAAIATLATAPSPISAVLSCVGDIAADTCSLFVDGQLAASSSADQGTGNFGNRPLYLFRRGGTILPFNGWFYGLAITGRLATNAETVATERFLAAKSAVVIP